MLPLALVAVLGAGAAVVAAQSGEAMEHTVRGSANEAGTSPRFGEHPEQGDRAEILSVVFALSAVGLYTIEHPRLQRSGVTRVHIRSAAVICSALAVLAFGAMVIAGHSGAELVWKDLGNFVSSSANPGAS